MIHTRKDYLFTSESVAAGHPDKLCDQISDAVLDLYLSRDPHARVAIEVMATPKKVILGGEISSNVHIAVEEIEQTVRQTIKEVGYEQKLFHWNKIDVENLLIEQSPDIAVGVNEAEGKEEGAGDQGIMFGYACIEAPEFMPAPIYYAHRILQNIAQAIKNGELIGLGPDAKSQVTLEYENGVPSRARSIVVSIQHGPQYTQQMIRDLIYPYIIKSLPSIDWMCAPEQFFVNPTGVFLIGGPEGDCGLTGRKIIVDTYGGAAPHGGGAFSGKDPTKVDRSAAYMARFVAKNIVAAGLAEKCLIQVSYAIGVSKPLSLYVNSYGTGKLSDSELERIITKNVDFSPRGIRTLLQLNRPIYKQAATYGHFGRASCEDGAFSWESLALVDQLKKCH